MRVWGFGAVALSGMLAAACSSAMTDMGDAGLVGGPVVAATKSRVAASVGQEVQFRIGWGFSSGFDSLPGLSSNAVRFLDAAIVPPYNPGGPVELFRFSATTPGRVVVSFRRVSEGGSAPRALVDTIDVY